MDIRYQVGTIDELLLVLSKVPELRQNLSQGDVLQRLGDSSHLILIALHEQAPVAFKLGYGLNKDVFYSWLGGVIPTFRNLGIANQLREQQEQWVAERGYRSIKVKSMNKYPAMLRLLIASDYQICDLEHKQSSQSCKIVFSKTLKY